MRRKNLPALPEGVSAPRPEECSEHLRRAEGSFPYRGFPPSAPPCRRSGGVVGVTEMDSLDFAAVQGGTLCVGDLPATHRANEPGIPLPLADASRRLRRRPGRPRRLLPAPPAGQEVQCAAPEPAKNAATAAGFPPTFQPRGLPIVTAASYSGIPVRSIWRLISEGRLTPVRVPGCRRVLILREELDALLEASKTTTT